MRNNNRQWRLVRYPQGLPQVGDWTMTEQPIPVAGEGELLARSLYLDVAPYMRGRISPQKNYAAGVAPGDVMVGGAVAEVVESNCQGYSAGDIVVADFAFGWQDFAVLKPSALRKVDSGQAPLPCWLDVLGLNGLTAYFGLFEAGSMKAGDTVLVSAAAGSVGQLVGQLTKLAGGRGVAVTSSPEKTAWCRELGYDKALDYRAEADLTTAIATACPNGVDVYFDNTAGAITDAALQNLAPHARITLCGTVSLADKFGEADIGPRFARQLLVARARLQGFLVMDHQDQFDDARRRLSEWHRDGHIKTRYDIAEGIERTPETFLRLLTSQNLGKQLVKVGD